MSEKQKNRKVFIIMLFLGSIGGTFIGDIIGKKFEILSFLSKSYSIGLVRPLDVDLVFFRFNFGFIFEANLMTIICIILVIMLYKNN